MQAAALTLAADALPDSHSQSSARNADDTLSDAATDSSAPAIASLCTHRSHAGLLCLTPPTTAGLTAGPLNIFSSYQLAGSSVVCVCLDR